MRIQLLILLMLSTKITATPRSWQITSLSSIGTGCPKDSVSTTIAHDNSSFTLIFDRFIVTNSGARQESHWHSINKNCHINVQIETPPGWSMAIISSQFRGFASLDKNVIGVFSANYRLGTGKTIPMGHIYLRGDFDDDYKLSHAAYLNSIAWIGCQQPKSISFQTKLSILSRNKNRTGMMTIDSLDSQIQQTYLLAWRKCDRILKESIATCKSSLFDKTMNLSQPIREYSRVFSGINITSISKSAASSALRDCEKYRRGNPSETCLLSCQLVAKNKNVLRLIVQQSAENIFTDGDKNLYKWVLKLAGADLNKIQRTEYHLHKSFGHKPFSRQNKKEGFLLQATGYSGFLVKIKAHLTSGGYRWLYHWLALPPKNYSKLRISTQQRQHRRLKSPATRKTWSDWQVWLTGPDLEKVKCVNYQLHSSYKNRLHRKCDLSNKFSLNANGWGSFKLKIELEMLNGQRQRLTHRLKIPGK